MSIDSAETNPLPKVSSARAWEAISFPKATPIIREKTPAPRPAHRLRADGTQEICAEDIMVIVPKATAPAPRPKPPSPEVRAAADGPKGTHDEELGDADIVIEAAPLQDVEVAAPEFRPPAYSINATQEILADDVLDVADAPLPPEPRPEPPPPHRDEIPSTVPWTVDAGDDLEFPSPPQWSSSYPAVKPRITNYSATQVFRRRSVNVVVVVASMSLAAAVVLVAGLARLTPTTTAEGPVGISVHAPKTLDSSIRTGRLAYGTAPRIQAGAAISIDSLPRVAHRRWR